MCNDLIDSSTCFPTELFSVYRISTRKPTEKVCYTCRIHTRMQSMYAVNVNLYTQIYAYNFYCIDNVIEFLDRVFPSKISRAKNGLFATNMEAIS